MYHTDISQKPLDEDVQLMLRVKDNDKNAFDRLIDKYHAPLINFIYRLVRDKAEAEDLAQEAFLRIYRSAAAYMPRAKFSTWLYKIAKNLALNELRRRSSRKTLSMAQINSDGESIDIDPADESPSPLEKAAKEEMARIVTDAIKTLPENQRIAVILSKYDDLSYEEIAEVIGCSAKAVKSLLSRAKTSLKERLFCYINKNNSGTF